MKKFKHTQQKIISVRFTTAEYLSIQQEAEQLGSNLAEVMRNAWSSYNNSEDFKTDLRASENRLISKFFEVCCAVQGLSQDERREAFEELKTKLNGDSK